jgi:leucyl-tRNA synthetase
MWQALGFDTILAQLPWPEADATLAKDDEIEIGVQVNGKLRDTLKLKWDCPDDIAKTAALNSTSVQRYLDGKSPKKVIIVQNRIINVVA